MRQQTRLSKTSQIVPKLTSKKRRQQQKKDEKEAKKNIALKKLSEDILSNESSSTSSTKNEGLIDYSTISELENSASVDDQVIISQQPDLEEMDIEEDNKEEFLIKNEEKKKNNSEYNQYEHVITCDSNDQEKNVNFEKIESNKFVLEQQENDEVFTNKINLIIDDANNQFKNNISDINEVLDIENDVSAKEASDVFQIEETEQNEPNNELLENEFAEGLEKKNNLFEQKDESEVAEAPLLNFVENTDEFQSNIDFGNECFDNASKNEESNESIEEKKGNNLENLVNNNLLDVSEFDIVEVTEEPMDIEETIFENEHNQTLGSGEEINSNLNENFSVTNSAFTIKTTFLQENIEKDDGDEEDYEMGDEKEELFENKSSSLSKKSFNDKISVLLDHERYILKKTNSKPNNQFSSTILFSKIDLISDICVNILENGTISFSNLSDKHVLSIEKNLLSLLNISIDELPFVQVFFTPNAKSIASLKKIDEITTNPGIVLLNYHNGTIWHFENLKYEFSINHYTKTRNDDLIKKDLKVNDSDIVYLDKIHCLLIKNHKKQLVLFNLLSKAVSKLKYSTESTKNSFFSKIFKYDQSIRSDVVDFEIENSVTQQTISVLFDSDFIFYNIKKTLTSKGVLYEFEEIYLGDSLEIPSFISQSVLGDIGAVIVLKFKKVHEDRNSKYYSFLISTGFNNLLILTARITDIFNVINFYNVSYFQQEIIDNLELISLDTAYIEGDYHYSSFIKSVENINLVQVPLLESERTSNIVFRDIISFENDTKIKNCVVYTLEGTLKSYCLLFQTSKSSKSSFYQLHIKDIKNRATTNTDSLNFFLEFHLQNYLMTNAAETGLNNIIHESWFDSDFTLLSNSLKSVVKKACLNENLNTIEKESVIENLLISVHTNIPYWRNCIVLKDLKCLILTLLDYLQLIKSFNSIKLYSDLSGEFINLSLHDTSNSFMNIEMMLVNTFENINKKLYEFKSNQANDASSYVNRAIKFFKIALYDPVIENVESHYRNNLFKEVLDSQHVSGLISSEQLVFSINEFLLLVGQINSIDANTGEGLYMLLKILYYQNCKAVNPLYSNNHLYWIESVLKVSTSQLNIEGKNNSFDQIIEMLEHYNDLIGVFKVLDFLLSKKLINYDNYVKIFSAQGEVRTELISKFVNFYVSKSQSNSIKLFFDIITNLDDLKLTTEVYKLLLENNKSGLHYKILWPFETLINKNFENAFNVLHDKLSNNESADNKYKKFELSIASLCSKLSTGELDNYKKEFIESSLNNSDF
ncbi:hypothetical protein QEN19_002255 [Hanseniaspora menglaensis]